MFPLILKKESLACICNNTNSFKVNKQHLAFLCIFLRVILVGLGTNFSLRSNEEKAQAEFKLIKKSLTHTERVTKGTGFQVRDLQQLCKRIINVIFMLCNSNQNTISFQNVYMFKKN